MKVVGPGRELWGVLAGAAVMAFGLGLGYVSLLLLTGRLDLVEVWTRWGFLSGVPFGLDPLVRFWAAREGFARGPGRLGWPLFALALAGASALVGTWVVVGVKLLGLFVDLRDRRDSDTRRTQGREA